MIFRIYFFISKMGIKMVYSGRFVRVVFVVFVVDEGFRFAD